MTFRSRDMFVSVANYKQNFKKLLTTCLQLSIRLFGSVVVKTKQRVRIVH